MFLALFIIFKYMNISKLKAVFCFVIKILNIILYLIELHLFLSFILELINLSK